MISRSTMAETIRVRFAPSPTGYLHVGGARTALFNWLYARRHGGRFILRIEDTDRSRSTEEAIEQILEAMRWLGLDWDEGPPTPGYRQTERMSIYAEHAERLLAEEKAYRCYCSPVELEGRRRAAQERGEAYRYDGRCRARADQPAANHVIRLAIPQEGKTVVSDLIHGEVTFDHTQLDDWILVRSDGTPTYNFCVVVDDVTMAVTHVIRGDDHLSNTPKQILCYQAFGYPVPVFAHIPMILGADRARLSKRHGATSVLAYREGGFLPQAVVNYLARLGWSHGDQEIFTAEELIEHFSLEKVGFTAAVFDTAKLEWLNGHWLRQTPAGKLAQRLLPFLERDGLVSDPNLVDLAWLERVVASLQERSKTLLEMARSARFYFVDEVAYDDNARAKFLTPAHAGRLLELIGEVKRIEPFAADALEARYRELAAQWNLKLEELAQLTRVALTGGMVSPPIFTVMAILGRDRVLARLARALAHIGEG